MSHLGALALCTCCTCSSATPYTAAATTPGPSTTSGIGDKVYDVTNWAIYCGLESDRTVVPRRRGRRRVCGCWEGGRWWAVLHELCRHLYMPRGVGGGVCCCPARGKRPPPQRLIYSHKESLWIIESFRYRDTGTIMETSRQVLANIKRRSPITIGERSPRLGDLHAIDPDRNNIH